MTCAVLASFISRAGARLLSVTLVRGAVGLVVPTGISSTCDPVSCAGGSDRSHANEAKVMSKMVANSHGILSIVNGIPY